MSACTSARETISLCNPSRNDQANCIFSHGNCSHNWCYLSCLLGASKLQEPRIGNDPMQRRNATPLSSILATQGRARWMLWRMGETLTDSALLSASLHVQTTLLTENACREGGKHKVDRPIADLLQVMSCLLMDSQCFRWTCQDTSELMYAMSSTKKLQIGHETNSALAATGQNIGSRSPFCRSPTSSWNYNKTGGVGDRALPRTQDPSQPGRGRDETWPPRPMWLPAPCCAHFWLSVEWKWVNKAAFHMIGHDSETSQTTMHIRLTGLIGRAQYESGSLACKPIQCQPNWQMLWGGELLQIRDDFKCICEQIS